MDAAASRDAHAFLDQAGWGNEQAPRTALLAALAHRRLGQASDADNLLGRARTVVESGSWTESLVAYFQARLTAQQLLSCARGDGEKTEAHTYVGLQEELAGRRADALSHLRWVREHGSTAPAEYALALGALKRLERAITPAP
jgi:thioredoxin-like negative regulator of GroEL